jgi:hypothetical protein
MRLVQAGPDRPDANAAMTERTIDAIQETLAGRGRAFSALLFVGPAVIASNALSPLLHIAILRGMGIVTLLTWAFCISNAEVFPARGKKYPAPPLRKSCRENLK